MPNLRLGPIADDRPVRLTITIPANVHRMLLAYAEVHGRQTGQVVAVDKLMPAMLERFMHTDRAFAREWRKRARNHDVTGPTS